jgi:hypothetical protein
MMTQVSLGITPELNRMAVMEIAEEHRWSWDRIAADIGVPLPTLRRWLNKWEPENHQQKRDLFRTDHLVTIYLATYTAPAPKPSLKPTKWDRVA